jgi:VanZ family protein
MMPDYTAGAMPRDFRSRGYRVAAMAALAYSLVIIYASLQPFTGWLAAATPFGAFLIAPWPRWITIEDVIFNFAAYLPLGFLLVLALCVRLHPRNAVLVAAAACALLSFVLESAQQYLPMRFASTVDLLVNTCGGAAGALIAPLFAPGRRLGEELALLRNRWFVGGPRGDAVLVLAGLWLLTHLHAAPISMGNGDLRSSLQLTALFPYAPDSYRYAEAGVVMLNVMALGLLLASAARATGSGYWRALALLVAGACALRTVAALLILRTASPWSWLTPGFAMGLAAAAILLLVLVRLPPRGRAAVALLALVAAVVLVNFTPENPYRNVPPYLLAGRSGHFLSFTSMIRALSDLWPFLTLLFLLVSLPGRHAAERH